MLSFLVDSVSYGATLRNFVGLAILAALTSSLKPELEIGRRGLVIIAAADSEVTKWPSIHTSSAATPTNNTASSISGRDYRRQVIRGEREAAVITRLPKMKIEECRAEQLTQIVKVKGCLPRTIYNRYCYGQCNSFFIPRAATQSSRRRSGRLHHQQHEVSSSTDSPVLPEHFRSGRGRRRSMREHASTSSATTSSSSSEAEDGQLHWQAFKSCSFCGPKRMSWITVVLNCPKRRPAYRRRRVQIVKECSCTALTLD